MTTFAPYEPTGELGQPQPEPTPAQKTVLSILALLGAGATGALVGQALGGKEWALTGGIVAPVVVLVVMAQRGAAGA